MGSSLSIENETSNPVDITIRLAGSVNATITDSIESKVQKKFHFPPSLGQSKTAIITVNGKACRAYHKSKSVRINETDKHEIRIVINRNGLQFDHSLQQIVENEERELNWNLVRDETVQDEYKKAANNVISTMNNITDFFGTAAGAILATIPVNKDISRLGTKIATDAIKGFMKTAKLTSSSSQANVQLLESLQKVECQLIAVSRTFTIDYFYLKHQPNTNNEKLFQFLHNLLLKLTNCEILPFLETCNNEEAVMMYITTVNLAVNIFHEMRQITNNDSRQLEERHLAIFVDNFRQIWHNFLDSISTDSRVKMAGVVIKTAELKFRDQHIYKVKSLFKSRMAARIKDIKEAFVQNRKYQWDCLYGHPDEIIDKWAQIQTPS